MGNALVFKVRTVVLIFNQTHYTFIIMQFCFIIFSFHQCLEWCSLLLKFNWNIRLCMVCWSSTLNLFQLFDREWSWTQLTWFIRYHTWYFLSGILYFFFCIASAWTVWKIACAFLMLCVVSYWYWVLHGWKLRF